MSRYALTEYVSEILDRPVTERSQNFITLCPFHQDDRPSLSIDLDRGLWLCFACGAKGGINSLARRLDKELNEGEILLATIDKAIQQGFEEPPDFTEKAMNLHREALTHRALPIVQYLTSRGIHFKAFEHFQLGWDSASQRISMPYYDDERVVAIKYRGLDGRKTNETGSKRILYNVNELRLGKPWAVVCEGESDTQAIWSELTRAGKRDSIAVVGMPGAAGSRSNWELYALEFLWCEKVFVAYDADEAGDKGAEVVLDVLGPKAVRYRPTDGKDWNEHLLNGGTLNGMG